MNVIKIILIKTFKESINTLWYIFISLILDNKDNKVTNNGQNNERGNENYTNDKQDNIDSKLFLKYATEKEKKRYRAMWYKEKNQKKDN